MCKAVCGLTVDCQLVGADSGRMSLKCSSRPRFESLLFSGAFSVSTMGHVRTKDRRDTDPSFK